MEVLDLLRTLTEPIGVPGAEDEVRQVIEELVRPYVDEVYSDPMGNLIARRHGADADLRLMLDAHMDEVGFMVAYIEDNGFLRLSPLGGWDERILPSHLVTVVSDHGVPIRGIIGTPPPHILSDDERKQPFRLDDLYVDIGAGSAEQVAALGIRIGSPAAISYPLQQLQGSRIAARALDDRAGCAVLIQTLERLAGEELPVTVVANFAVAEEVGLRGAQVAAYHIEPHVALAVETTVAADVPGVAPWRQPTRMGAGPAITVADRTLIADRQVMQTLVDAAIAENIPYQFKLPSFGGTDAGAIQRTRGGVRAGVVSIPARYIHSPFNVIDLNDFQHTVDLVVAFVRRSRSAFVSGESHNHGTM